MRCKEGLAPNSSHGTGMKRKGVPGRGSLEEQEKLTAARGEGVSEWAEGGGYTI